MWQLALGVAVAGLHGAAAAGGDASAALRVLCKTASQSVGPARERRDAPRGGAAAALRRRRLGVAAPMCRRRDTRLGGVATVSRRRHGDDAAAMSMSPRSALSATRRITAGTISTPPRPSRSSRREPHLSCWTSASTTVRTLRFSSGRATPSSRWTRIRSGCGPASPVGTQQRRRDDAARQRRRLSAATPRPRLVPNHAGRARAATLGGGDRRAEAPGTVRRSGRRAWP